MLLFDLGWVLQGLKQLNWKSPGIKEFVDNVAQAVSELNTVLYNVNHCVDQLQKLLDGWSAAPLLERRDVKKLLNLDEERVRVRSCHVLCLLVSFLFVPSDILCCLFVVVFLCLQAGQKFAQISSDGREIMKLLQKANEYFGVGKAHPNWKDYVQFVNQKAAES